ncbi:hypothetical protein DM02DRAFT_99448 [Periconia macrospinosa]|uniref:Uncharacterized protein n=1 Tax=Periconia macrospinosa TaxID=97972 RepID=A0A2V1E5L3_9PLEO|nr:hypothetical protein DM02DRAFT_99448 [Periconia macrospinosa]
MLASTSAVNSISWWLSRINILLTRAACGLIITVRFHPGSSLRTPGGIGIPQWIAKID